jgi:hypothetical protein
MNSVGRSMTDSRLLLFTAPAPVNGPPDTDCKEGWMDPRPILILCCTLFVEQIVLFFREFTRKIPVYFYFPCPSLHQPQIYIACVNRVIPCSVFRCEAVKGEQQ